MGGGSHCQTKYSLIMTDPLKQGYKGRGKDQGLEQKLREWYMRERWEHSLRYIGLARIPEGKLGYSEAFSARLKSR